MSETTLYLLTRGMFKARKAGKSELVEEYLTKMEEIVEIREQWLEQKEEITSWITRNNLKLKDEEHERKMGGIKKGKEKEVTFVTEEAKVIEIPMGKEDIQARLAAPKKSN